MSGVKELFVSHLRATIPITVTKSPKVTGAEAAPLRVFRSNK